MPRLHKRQQPYKRCDASARQRSYCSSFRSRAEFTRRHNLLGERLETRLAAKIVEQGIDLDEEKIIGVAALVSAFQLIERTLFLAQAEINERNRVRRHV